MQTSENVSSCSASALSNTLRNVILEELSNTAGTSTVINAGYFDLSFRGGNARDPFCDLESGHSSSLHSAEVATRTWHGTCQALKRYGGLQYVKLMAVVNDWQRLQPPANSHHEREVEAARLRSEYYQSVPTLPQPYLQMLAEYGISTENIFKQDSNCWMFSEHRLRKSFGTAASAMLRDDPGTAEACGLRCEISGQQKGLFFSGEDGVDYCLLHSGNTNCAGEMVQLLHELNQRGAQRFINVYPAQCRNPVGVGTAVARSMYDIGGLSVTNVAVSSIGADAVQIFIDRA